MSEGVDELTEEGLMRWITGTALVVALLALSLQFWRPAGAQAPWPRYQATEIDKFIVRLDTVTGEMVAFGIGPRAVWEEKLRPQLEEYGKIEFVEIARSVSKEGPK